MVWLPDGNVLVALVVDSHVHHARARAWFRSTSEPFATCATTEGTLLRLHMQTAVDASAGAAWATLCSLTSHQRHVFWGDALSYADVPHRHLQGAKQVTDAWLAELARRRGGRMVTFDGGLALLHSDVAVTVPE